MKLSFLPGDLHLRETQAGEYVVVAAGTEVFRGTASRARSKFNQLRREMETRFPARDLTPEERRQMLRDWLGDSLVGHNSLGGRKKKSTAGGTRTFGG
ncbi:MAG: hypothetical protein WA188_06800 [Terriglobales bacterium]